MKVENKNMKTPSKPTVNKTKHKPRSTNPFGRGKGIKDKVNTDLKILFKELIEGNMDNIQKWIEKTAETSPAAAVRLINDFIPYVIPALKNSEMTIEEKRTEINYKELSDTQLKNIYESQKKILKKTA